MKVDVGLHAVPMELRHELRQVLEGEVPGPDPGVVVLQAEVDRVRSGANGGPKRIDVPGGGENLRFQRGCCMVPS